VLSGDGLVLFAVNAGSNDISVLGVKRGRLSLLSKKGSGGVFPNSIALSDNLVYVLNSKGDTPNVTGFRLDVSGNLHRLATVPLPAGSMAPNDIRFAPDGSELLVTVAATNQILVFPLAADGVAGSPVPQVSAGMQPFGMRFTHNEVLLVTEAAGSLSSYQPTGADMLDTISGAVPDMQMATCWISVPRDGKFAWVSNTASGNLSSYSIAPDGTLSLLDAVAADPEGNPIDSALSSDGRYLYVQEAAQGKVVEYRVEGANLTPIGTITVEIGNQGIAAQ
jgi:DNA-binding beta-propeller fold protein YncE